MPSVKGTNRRNPSTPKVTRKKRRSIRRDKSYCARIKSEPQSHTERRFSWRLKNLVDGTLTVGLFPSPKNAKIIKTEPLSPTHSAIALNNKCSNIARMQTRRCRGRKITKNDIPCTAYFLRSTVKAVAKNWERTCCLSSVPTAHNQILSTAIWESVLIVPKPESSFLPNSSNLIRDQINSSVTPPIKIINKNDSSPQSCDMPNCVLCSLTDVMTSRKAALADPTNKLFSPRPSAKGSSNPLLPGDLFFGTPEEYDVEAAAHCLLSLKSSISTSNLENEVEPYFPRFDPTDFGIVQKSKSDQNGIGFVSDDQNATPHSSSNFSIIPDSCISLPSSPVNRVAALTTTALTSVTEGNTIDHLQSDIASIDDYQMLPPPAMIEEEEVFSMVPLQGPDSGIIGIATNYLSSPDFGEPIKRHQKFQLDEIDPKTDFCHVPKQTSPDESSPDSKEKLMGDMLDCVDASYALIAERLATNTSHCNSPTQSQLFEEPSNLSVGNCDKMDFSEEELKLLDPNYVGSSIPRENSPMRLDISLNTFKLKSDECQQIKSESQEIKKIAEWLEAADIHPPEKRMCEGSTHTIHHKTASSSGFECSSNQLLPGASSRMLPLDDYQIGVKHDPSSPTLGMCEIPVTSTSVLKTTLDTSNGQPLRNVEAVSPIFDYSQTDDGSFCNSISFPRTSTPKYHINIDASQEVLETPRGFLPVLLPLAPNDNLLAKDNANVYQDVPFSVFPNEDNQLPVAAETGWAETLSSFEDYQDSNYLPSFISTFSSNQYLISESQLDETRVPVKPEILEWVEEEHDTPLKPLPTNENADYLKTDVAADLEVLLATSKRESMYSPVSIEGKIARQRKTRFSNRNTGAARTRGKPSGIRSSNKNPPFQLKLDQRDQMVPKVDLRELDEQPPTFF